MKLELRDVSLQYPEKPPLFEGVNLTLEPEGFLIVAATVIGTVIVVHVVRKLCFSRAHQIIL